ncbi:MAG: hypothetical protein QOC96_906 [Acidobacteriota bacterium]|jgi:hypothetical protein|nr:hypothetical protein [Acidobacteriota bacterium]
MRIEKTSRRFLKSAIQNPHSAIGMARVLRVFNDDHLVKRRDV